MKKQFLLKTMLLLCALIAGSGMSWADDYELYSGTITEGDYLIVYSGKAMKNTVSNNRLSYETVKATNDVISTTDASIVWHVSLVGNYARLYNASVSKYAAGTGADNKAQLLASGTDDKSQWSVTGSSTYEFVNKYNKSEKKNCNLRNNGTYGFACYSTSTGGALSLYKKKDISATALEVKTAPTKTEYMVGETLDLTGLVLSATIGGTPTDVTTGYTASPANGATLSEAGTKTVTFTYGGQEATQTIYVGSLTGISVKNAPTKTSYDEGQTFDPTGMVLTATYDTGDGHTWTEDVTTGYTFEPNTALSSSDTEITITYGGQSTTQIISVTAGVPYTVSFDAGAGTYTGGSIAEASFGAGVTLPAATIGLTGWSFAGWATAATTNTETAPTLYAAESTYHPTDNVTLYAVYKYGYASAKNFKRATSVSEITGAEKIAIAYNDGKVLNTNINLSTTLSEDNSGIAEPAANAIFTLSGDNTNGFTLTNGTNTIGTSGSGASLSIALSTTNNKWTFSTSTYNTNLFHVNNVDASGKSLEVYNNAWKAYALTANGQAWSMRVYIPATDYVYNSNPTAIVNPTIAFTASGDKNLYVQDDATYDNAANVTGIDKTPIYSSSDATVATVSETGVVTALKAGEATITAKIAAEAGVNTEASVSYVVTVKDAKTIAGLKAITDASSVVTFTADLTDAVVTYVKDGHAYIQDASGAVYASCGSSLTAGKKINGAVSGSIKAAYKIDEITAIDLSDATVTEDGVIPAALTKTVAELIASGTTFEGQLVQVSGATVTASLENGSASGGKITDDAKVSEINLYAPASNIEALKDAEGTFTGFISYYNASTYRLNIYDQSQITLTKNASTDQPLAFDSDAVELDEDTEAYTAFAGQTVSGAKGTVTYSIDSDDDGVVTSIDASTGAVVLSGEYGTATIKASAAATETTEGGVTTPWKATTKTYTISVYPRYSVTFNINGVETIIRQASHGAEIAVPTPAAVGDYAFRGWSAAAVAATNTAPEMTEVTNAPTANATYYAVFARAIAGEDVEETSSFDFTNTTPTSPFVNNEGTWTWSSITRSSSSNNIGLQSTSITFTPSSNVKSIKSVKVTKSANQWGKNVTISLTDNSNDEIETIDKDMIDGGSTSETYYEIDLTSDQSTKYVLTSSGNAWVKTISFKYLKSSVAYSNYCTTIPAGGVTMGADNDSEQNYTYATFSADEDVVFTSDVTVFALNTNGEKLEKNELTTGDFLITDQSYNNGVVEGGYYVPAGTGVMLRSTSTSIAYYFADDQIDPIPAVPTNLLIAGTGTTPNDADHKYYKLTYATSAKDALGFYWGAENGAPFLLKKGKAYLVLPKSVDARSFMLNDEDDVTTGVEGLKNSMTEELKSYYNLAGQRVAQPAKGLYIVNGKKVVIK